jgi:hypothetical protein
MREVPRSVQGVCYALSVATLFFCAIYTSIEQHFLLLTIYILAMAFIIYDSQCHKLTLFYLYQRVRNTLEENERNADEKHANEMRAMIGNVAHDLKTVSSLLLFIPRMLLIPLPIFSSLNSL